MLKRMVLCILFMFVLAGCGGMSKALLIEPPIRSCTSLELDRVQPLPVVDVAYFSFCLPDSGHTRLTVLDANYRLMATIVDSMLCTDVYAFTWRPPDSLAGEYYLHLNWRNELRKKKFLIR